MECWIRGSVPRWRPERSGPALSGSAWGRCVATLLLVAMGQSASACKIPVFRYALERWSPDVYTLQVVHRGPLDAAALERVEQLRSAATSPTTPGNFRVELHDLSQRQELAQPQADEAAAPTEAALAERYGELDGPQLVLRYPLSAGIAEPAWSGPLSDESVQRLTNSPARRQVVERILGGDSAVWVLIESGNEAADAEAAATLERELLRMEESLRLPSAEELAAEEEFQSDTLVQLRIAFSTLRLKRDDPDEAIFVEMLLRSENDLAELQEPIAIPIFGRGRTYYALVGQGIKGDTIEDNCRFICGDCSCQVKEQNPGVDMLLAVSWDTQVRGTSLPDRELPALTGIGGLQIFDLDALEAQEGSQAPSRNPPAPPAGEVPPGTDDDRRIVEETAPPDDVGVVLADGGSVPAPEGDELVATAENPDAVLSAEDPARLGSGLLRWVFVLVVVALGVVAASSVWIRARSAE